MSKPPYHSSLTCAILCTVNEKIWFLRWISIISSFSCPSPSFDVNISCLQLLKSTSQHLISFFIFPSVNNSYFFIPRVARKESKEKWWWRYVGKGGSWGERTSFYLKIFKSRINGWVFYPLREPFSWYVMEGFWFAVGCCKQHFFSFNLCHPF